jgi:hypothetical protein
MKRLAKVLGIAVGAVALVSAAAFLLVESGEVVVLRTIDEHDHESTTRLWVVDHDGHPSISTGTPSSRQWLRRLRTHSEVELVRDGVATCRRAVIVEEAEARERIGILINAKYHVQIYGSKFLNLFAAPRGDRAEPVVIRLEPCPPNATGSPSNGSS